MHPRASAFGEYLGHRSFNRRVIHLFELPRKFNEKQLDFRGIEKNNPIRSFRDSLFKVSDSDITPDTCKNYNNLLNVPGCIIGYWGSKYNLINGIRVLSISKTFKICKVWRIPIPYDG